MIGSQKYLFLLRQTYNFIDGFLISVCGKDKFFAEKFLQLMSHLSELVYLHSGGSVDQSSEVLVHIFGRPKLLNGL
jgi:hypothetical protein